MKPKSNLLSKLSGRTGGIIWKISMLPLNRKKFCLGILLLILIVFGGVLRFYDLTAPPFLGDEAISTMVAMDISETGYPPIDPRGGEYWRSVFHTSIIAVFLEVMGIGVLAARMPSVIFGTLTIFLIYLFGKELMNWKVGIISAFLMFFNVFAIDISRMARMYALFQFFYLLTLYFFYKGFESKKGRSLHLFKGKIRIEDIKPLYLGLSAVAFIITILCHQGGAMIILSILFYALLMGWVKRGKHTNSKKPLDKYILSSILLILLIFIGFFVGISTNFGRNILMRTVYVELDVKSSIINFIFYGQYFLQNFPLEWSFATLGILLLLINRNKNGAFIFSSFFIPLILQLTIFHPPWRNHRYLSHLLPLFLVLSSYGIYQMAKYFKIGDHLKVRHRFIPRFCVIVVLFLLVFAGFSYAYIATQRGKIASPYWREACEYVLTNSNDNTSLITSAALIPEFYLGSEEYGLRYQYNEYAHKNITIYGRQYLKTRESLENFTRTHDNGWVIVDMDRWNWEEVITEDAKKYLQENMTFHPFKYHMYIFIYSWGYE